ncbi:hypothetical protein K435DRAFT_865244 [Dendrothele bispora CBS 962.96]|uniref:Uncharacterized protein n=1 Tax=Dendrothele bispora (strain CBS 962.96) TaxID=1314807 RepID=A0A4S8LKH9_DENBC|nr:hypothetical protein K435DRAFT_865244 [Dendrothele bispora CBS 962.96]
MRDRAWPLIGDVYGDRQVEFLWSAHAMGLLNPQAVLGVNGIAEVPSDTVPSSHNFPSPPQTLRGATTGLLNYIHKTEKNENMYTPFTCHCPNDWPAALEVYTNFVDYTKCLNESTLGPYSFQVFVDKHAKATKPCGHPPKNAHRYTRPKTTEIPVSLSHKSQMNQLEQMHYEGVENNEELDVGEALDQAEGEAYGGGRASSSRTRSYRDKPY